MPTLVAALTLSALLKMAHVDLPRWHLAVWFGLLVALALFGSMPRTQAVLNGAGSFLAAVARYHADAKESLAFIAGGETVVRVTGSGLGGRNQELALAAARGIAGLADTAVISVGSDGTDGPTDAAGGYVDGDTDRALSQQGVDVCGALERNDAYRALARCGGLVVTGPTGTNVNDVAVLLIRR